MRRTHLCIALFALASVLLVSAPTYASAAQNGIKEIGHDCEQDTIINSPGDSNGAIVKTDDGHIWLIDEVDRIDSQLWLTGDDVIVCWTAYSYEGTTTVMATIYNGEDKDDARLLQ